MIGEIRYLFTVVNTGWLSGKNATDMLCCRHDERLAVKIVRNIEKYHYAAKVEVDILCDLQKSDSPAKE